MRGLFFKELRQLLPFVWVLMAVECLSLVEHFITKSPLDVAWSDLTFVLTPEHAGVVALVLGIIAFVAASMLFPRERDEGTLDFLYSLPISRGEIFLAKFGAVCALLVGFNAVDGVLSWWMQTFNTGSITSTQFRLDLAVFEFALASAFTVICAAYGVLLSTLRRMAIPVAVGIWVVLEVLAQAMPSASPLNVMKLLELDYVGSEPSLRPVPWALHLVAGAGALVWSAHIWLGEEQRGTRHRFSGWRWRLAYWGALATAGVVGLGVWSGANDQMGDKASRREVATVETEHAHLTYPVARRAQAMHVAKGADRGVLEVQRALRASPAGKVIADLTEQSDSHLGIAAWKKIRIDITSNEEPEVLDHVWIHELVHVFAAAESQRRITQHHRETFFFSEGLAEYVSHELLPLDESRQGLRTLAAAASMRFNLRFEHLLNRDTFVTEYDENLAYALGEAWVAGLVKACGPRATGDVLRAMGRAGAPQELSGREFWQDTLLSMKCDLDAVNRAWRQVLRAAEGRAQAIPEVVCGFVGEDPSGLVFRVQLHGEVPPGTKVVVRVRDSNRDVPAGVTAAQALVDDDGRAKVTVSTASIFGAQFQFQGGVVWSPEARPFYTRWQRGLRQP